MIDGFLLLAGVLLGLGSAALPSLAWMILGSVSAIAVLCTPLRRSAIPSAVALLLVGLGLAWSSTWHWLSLRMAASRADERVLFEGRILSVPAREGAETHFDVRGTLVDEHLPRQTDRVEETPLRERRGVAAVQPLLSRTSVATACTVVSYLTVGRCNLISDCWGVQFYEHLITLDNEVLPSVPKHPCHHMFILSLL